MSDVPEPSSPRSAGCSSEIACPRFAAILPVGPGAADARRYLEVVRTLLHWEPALSWCVLVDDCVESRHLENYVHCPRGCEVVSIVNPRRGRGYGHTGGLFVGIAAALSWIHSNTDAEFVLKIDTDALVIGAFAAAIGRALAENVEAGIIGALGCSCNPEVRDVEDLECEPELLLVHRLLRADCSAGNGAVLESGCLVGRRRLSATACLAFTAIRPHIVDALSHGYRSDHNCQGGAYAITRRMLDRMVSLGYLARPDPWADLPVGEDRIMAMYCRAVNLRAYDYSRPGQPFGVQSYGLPYPPEMLLDLGYCLIHSVKNDGVYSESEIKAFFRTRAGIRTE